MSYLHPDGTPDTPEEILESARCFVAVIGKMLEPNEGMVVELAYQEDYPDDKWGKYIVWKDEKTQQVKIDKLSTTNHMYDAPNGQMVWVHTECCVAPWDDLYAGVFQYRRECWEDSCTVEVIESTDGFYVKFAENAYLTPLSDIPVDAMFVKE